MSDNPLLVSVCKNVRDAILDYLREHDMKRYALADKANLNHQMIDNYICMRYAPNSVNCIKLADAIGITVDELIKGK